MAMDAKDCACGCAFLGIRASCEPSSNDDDNYNNQALSSH